MPLCSMSPGDEKKIGFDISAFIDEFTTLLWHEIREKAILSRFAAVAHLFLSLMDLS